MQKQPASQTWPLILTFLRLPLFLLADVAILLLIRSTGFHAGLATLAEWATVSVTMANIICLGLLVWRARVEDFRLRDMIGFQRGRFLKDLGWGGVWLFGLFLAMVLAVVVLAFLLQKTTGMDFPTLFMGGADFSFEPPRGVLIGVAVVSASIFPLLNAPTEELLYRGYAQPRLTAATGSPWKGILVQAVGFGLQHAVFAYTLISAPVYVFAYFIWGIGAGWIVRRQKRLLPLIIAHCFSNLAFGVIPLVFILSGAG